MHFIPIFKVLVAFKSPLSHKIFLKDGEPESVAVLFGTEISALM